MKPPPAAHTAPASSPSGRSRPSHWARLWQHGLPSPHLHYFTRAGLTRLVREHGLVVEQCVALSAIARSGLWERVHTFRRPTPVSVAGFAALWSAAPLLNRPRHSDIMLLLARRAQ